MSYIGNSPGVASQRVTTTLTATAGQTQFTAQSGYVLGYVDVYLNGAKLVNGSDFEAITGTYITLFAGAAVGDVIELISYVPRGLSDGYTKAEADAKFLDVGGDTATGAINLGTNGLVVGTNQLVASGGFVGIGTASPTVKLHLEGAANSAPVTLLRLNNAGSASGGPGIASRISFTVGASSLGFIQGSNYATGATGLQFSGDGTNSQLLLDSTGNVGINTITPGGKLDVNGSTIFRGNTTVASGNILYLSNSVNTGSGTIFCPGGGSLSLASYGNEMIRLNEDNAIIFKVGSATERARIDSSGNLTIGPNGTANTNSSKLVVAGTISQTVGGTQYQVVDQSDIGTAQNQIPLNQYLGSMAFQDRENISFAGGTGALSSLDIAAVSQQLNVAATDIFVYDTSRDSDGGAWRKRCQNTTWYNETLNTSTRGLRREFPAVAVIVAEAGGVTIYDGDSPDLPMWIKYNNDGVISWATGGTAGAGAVCAFNGIVVIGIASGSGGGTIHCDFVKDDMRLSYNTGNYALKQRNISARNALRSVLGNLYYSGGDGYNVIGYVINDIAMTVLSNAPVDTVSGLPVPTIALATTAGVSVIHNNQTVNNISESSGPNSVVRITFRSDSKLMFYTTGTSSNGSFPQAYACNIPYNNYSGGYFYLFTDALLPGFEFWGGNWDNVGLYGNRINVSSANTVSGAANNAISNSSGLFLLAPEISKPASSMHAQITSKYNTGYILGDIKGAWLSDINQETIVSSNLVSNGTFDSNVTGWTAVGTGASISWNAAGRINVTTGTDAWGGAYTTVQVVAGKTYIITGDITSNGGGWAGISGSYAGGNSGLKAFNGANPSATSYTFYHTATQTGTLYITIDHSNTTSTNTIVADNISVRVADFDRSVNNKPLTIYGSITKTPVAIGADLVSYSGFSGSNYLQQPYNSAFDFGTNDFMICAWVKTTNNSTYQVIAGKAYWNGSLDVSLIGLTLSGLSPYIEVRDNTGSGQYTSTSATTIMSDTWTFLCGVRRSGTLYMYSNGVLISTATGNKDVSGSTTYPSKFTVGVSASGVVPCAGSIALVRISATAPTADQIVKMYNDEKVLFQENAKATLYGTSDSVTALAYDEHTKLVHAGTSAGRSTFQGLRRVDNTITAVATAISAADGLVAEN